MEIKKRTNEHVTTQYTINDGYDFEVTEILGGEDYSIVAIYDEDAFCVALFRLVCCRGTYAFGGTISCVEEHEYFNEDELSLIAQYIIDKHNKRSDLFDEMTN